MTHVLPGLAAYLALRGHGVYSTTDPYQPGDVAITLGTLPDAPDRCIALATSSPPESNSGEPYDQMRIRIRVRGTPAEPDSRERAQAIYDELHGLGVTQLPNGGLIVNCVCTTPVWAGTDKSNRHETVVTALVEHYNPARIPL